MPPRTADELRAAFLAFFEARGHAVVPSASLIPHDQTLLFTNSGMVPFKPYFVGDETPASRRATSVQKCVRAGGKHNDLEDVGRTNRHFTFFEMLGNFSFGDYSKTEAIEWAWELYQDVLQLPADRLWVTVHVSDDEAAEIWHKRIGLPEARIQRLDEDNFWRMADTGPCGPSSEIFWDLGEEFGADGGPVVDENRYVELWNLVFMQYNAQPDGQMVPLPSPSIDTGAGLERNLAVLQGAATVWDTDAFRPLIAAAEKVSGVTYGGFPGSDADTSLRILAEHGRTMTFLVADGVVPSNEERGYVLRRIIRRAVRHAFLLGATDAVTPALVDATVRSMGNAYPEIVKSHELVASTVQREEERFRQTLERGLDMLDDLLAKGDVSGEDAFFLHDTLGFPIDLTREIAQEHAHNVDLAGFEAKMEEQRRRAVAAHKSSATAAPTEAYRELYEEIGATEFAGRQELETVGAKVRGLVQHGARVSDASSGEIEVVLDRTPFYAESGGQVGDTGTLTTDRGVLVRVIDTQYGLNDLVVHRGTVEEGTVGEGDEVTARVDTERRNRIRRNHTATHVLHWALREVLGSHVQQAGSLVAPDRLRFDFSHFEAVTREQLDEIEARANAEVITDAPVRHYETTKEHAESLGAIAFFGDKYGDLVRVLEAGAHSIELCGGTHVHALGFIGPIKIVSEGSIGANLRRIEAVTGDGALAYIRQEEMALRDAADRLSVGPTEVGERVERLLAEIKELRGAAEAQRRGEATADAKSLAAGAVDGVVVARRDGLSNDDLRRLAIAARDALGSGIVGLIGLAPDGAKVALSVAVTKDLVERGANAGTVAQAAAKAVGGGTAKQSDAVAGGGPNIAAIDEAFALLEEQAKQAAAAAAG
ncbi:MAG: alanine--tRNA ligase [Actinobacteria bacterium]|nr:alanine--tRNA ligase [Actinomycetota bacterium]